MNLADLRLGGGCGLVVVRYTQKLINKGNKIALWELSMKLAIIWSQ